MNKAKWYTLLALTVALLLGSGITTAAQPGNDQPASAHIVAATATSTPGVASCWSVVPSPNLGTGYNILQGVATISPSDVWALGYSGTNTLDGFALAEHWNGSSWSIIPSPSVGTSAELYGVAAIASSDVWAVGHYYDSSTNILATLVEHWNGTSWSVVPSPNRDASSELYGVAAISSSDVWAVGSSSTTHFNEESTLTEHWNGTSWSVVTSPNPGTSINELRGIAAKSSNDVWAVGDYLTSSASNTLIEHWNGTSWSIIPSPSPSTTYNALFGVAAISPGDVWAVGYDGNNYITLTEHWNGSSWSVVPSPNPSTSNVLEGVAAISSSDVWTVGYDRANSLALTEHWDGSSWSVVASSSAGVLEGVAALSSGDLWAVGNSGNNTLVEHCSPPIVCPVPFTDITGNVFYNAIAYLYCRGALNGTDATHYSPALTTTRAQFAKVVVLAFSLPTYTPTNGQDFTDVPIGYFAYGYIETGFHAGILGGYDANTCAAHNAAFPCYLPNLPITRGQVTKLIVSAAHYALLTPTGGNPTFTDVPPANVFFVSIETAHAHGVINGYPDGTFRPNNNVRRDEMAQIVFKGLTSP